MNYNKNFGSLLFLFPKANDVEAINESNLILFGQIRAPHLITKHALGGTFKFCIGNQQSHHISKRDTNH
jgi:hypothetical protein